MSVQSKAEHQAKHEAASLDDQRRIIADLRRLHYQRAEHEFAHFFRLSWDVIEPGRPLLWNWHHDLICEYLMAAHRRQVKRLIINVPPRYTKSNIISVAFPVWSWLHDPSHRFMSASYSQSLSTKHSVDRRTLIESDWFQAAWASRFRLASDQNVKTMFQNEHRGHMIATSMQSSATGLGASTLLIDDPHDTTRAASDVKRKADIDAFDQKFTSRLDDKVNGVIIVVMQRLHERDLTGHLLEQGGWEHVCLPAVAPARVTVTFPISGRTLERQEGDILHPRREDPGAIDKRRRELGTAGFQSQYQQDPRPMDGGFIPRAWWRRWKEQPMHQLSKMQFWDCAEKPGITNDYSVCATWVETPTGYYLIDLARARLAFPDLERAVKDQAAKHSPDAVVIEDKSAGTQVIQNLRATTPLPIIPWNPGRDAKEVRAAGVQPTIEAGNCYLPDSAAWVDDFIQEHERFPNAEHDDQVDTTSMALAYFKQKRITPWIGSI